MLETNTGTLAYSTDFNESRVTEVMLDNTAKMDWTGVQGMGPWLARFLPQVIVKPGITLTNVVNTELEAEDWAAFSEHLKNPPKPNQYLRSLVLEFGSA
jgi:hypothetical protein